MIVRGASLGQIESALHDVNKVFGRNVQFSYPPKSLGSGWQLTLRVLDSRGPGARLSYSGRHLVAACWHVHGLFFDSLPDRVSVRVAGQPPITPGEAWRTWDIGSQVRPFDYSEACGCIPAYRERSGWVVDPTEGEIGGSFLPYPKSGIIALDELMESISGR